jgi:hypothetical protein
MSAADRAAYALALIRHRIPEIDAAELAQVEAALSPQASDVPALERVLDAVMSLEQRFDAMVERGEAQRRIAEAAAEFIDAAGQTLQ